MGQQPSQPPSLVVYLASRYLPQVIEKGWFGKRRVRAGSLFMVELYLFVTGAVLGRALRHRLDVLATMFSEPGGQKNAINFLLERAERRTQLYGRKLECTFFEFFLSTKSPALSPEENFLALQLNAKTIVPLADASANAQVAVAEGVGFGARYPDLTETLYRRMYEQVDATTWKQAHDFGLGIPEQPDQMTLEEFEHEVLPEVAAFASEHYPELLEPLGLNPPRRRGVPVATAESIQAGYCPSCGVRPKPADQTFCDACTISRMHQH